jgi:hypothetical protein
MTTLIVGAHWVDLSLGVLLAGAFFLLLLAGPPRSDLMRIWERRVLGQARWFALASFQLEMDESSQLTKRSTSRLGFS